MFFSKTRAPLPPACSECVRTVIGPLPGAIPSTSSLREYRDAAGRTRIDMGEMSIITNPKTGERMILNHALMEATMLAPGAPGMSLGVGAAPPDPRELLKMAKSAGIAEVRSRKAEAVQLGKSYIDGHEVEGMRMVFPATPGMAIPRVSLWEIWTSVKLRTPVMTKTTGSFGESTTICRVSAAPPPPGMFEVPARYRVVTPSVPGVPGVPGIPAMPSAPGVSNVIPNVAMPSAPSMPQAPSMPNAPGIPNVAIPNAPSMPHATGIPNVAIPNTPSIPAMPQPPAVPNIAPPNLPPIPQAPSIPNVATPKVPDPPIPPLLQWKK